MCVCMTWAMVKASTLLAGSMAWLDAQHPFLVRFAAPVSTRTVGSSLSYFTLDRLFRIARGCFTPGRSTAPVSTRTVRDQQLFRNVQRF